MPVSGGDVWLVTRQSVCRTSSSTVTNQPHKQNENDCDINIANVIHVLNSQQYC